MTGPRDLDDLRNPARIPLSTIEALERHVTKGYPPGSFLEAVLANDLKGACKLGDEDNLHGLVALVGYIYNKVPVICSGTKTLVRLWIELAAAERLGADPGHLDQIRAAQLEALSKRTH